MCVCATCFSAASTCVLSLICALLLAYFDRRAERILNKEEGKTGQLTQFFLWLVHYKIKVFDCLSV